MAFLLSKERKKDKEPLVWGRYTREEILAIGTTSRQKKDAIRPQPKKRVIRKTSMDFGTWPGSLSIIAS